MNTLPITVGIIDDDCLYSQILTKLFKKAGITVVFQASNGLAGIEAIAASTHKPEVVVVDIEMPVMDGFETIRYLKKEWPELLTIAHSSLTDLQAQQRVIACGAQAFVLKNAMDELLTAIQQLAKPVKQ